MRITIEKNGIFALREDIVWHDFLISIKGMSKFCLKHNTPVLKSFLPIPFIFATLLTFKTYDHSTSFNQFGSLQNGILPNSPVGFFGFPKPTESFPYFQGRP